MFPVLGKGVFASVIQLRILRGGNHLGWSGWTLRAITGVLRRRKRRPGDRGGGYGEALSAVGVRAPPGSEVGFPRSCTGQGPGTPDFRLRAVTGYTSVV